MKYRISDIDFKNYLSLKDLKINLCFQHGYFIFRQLGELSLNYTLKSDPTLVFSVGREISIKMGKRRRLKDPLWVLFPGLFLVLFIKDLSLYIFFDKHESFFDTLS